jgi:hypothetical protein
VKPVRAPAKLETGEILAYLQRADTATRLAQIEATDLAA